MTFILISEFRNGWELLSTQFELKVQVQVVQSHSSIKIYYTVCSLKAKKVKDSSQFSHQCLNRHKGIGLIVGGKET